MPDIEMKCQILLNEKELHVDYVVINRGRFPIYLLNRLYSLIPKIKIDPNLIYVHLDEESKLIELAKLQPQLPKGYLVNSPYCPYVTAVASLTKFNERVSIKLPLREFRQYSPDLVGKEFDYIDKVWERIQFRVGYFEGNAEVQEEIREIAGEQVVFPRFPVGQQPVHGLLQSQVIEGKIPVQLRREKLPVIR